MPFSCFSLISIQDRPHNVYISLKLRASYIQIKKENKKDHTWKTVMRVEMRHVGDPDPREGIEIQLS